MKKSNFASPQQKFADFFDIQHQEGESLTQFRQKIAGTLGHYKNYSDTQKAIEIKQQIKEDINKTRYKVEGFDENLIKHMEQRGQKLKLLQIGTEKEANKLFERMSNFVKMALPDKFVDGQGNIWRKCLAKTL